MLDVRCWTFIFYFVLSFTGITTIVLARDPDSIYEMATNALENGRTSEALELALSLIEYSSGSTAGKEALYVAAQAFENIGNFKDALSYYTNYLKTAPFSVHQQEARLKGLLIREALKRNDSVSLKIFLKALYQRDKGNYDKAAETARYLAEKFPVSHLADDALHLIAYINLMDQMDYSMAISAYRNLANTYPDSNYIDSALYGEGLAMEKIGQFTMAEEKYKTLLKRHTAISLPFTNVRLPKDNYLSRVWFKKVDNRLNDMDERSRIYQEKGAILARESFNFGLGGMFTVDQPVGSGKNYRNIWHLVAETGFKPAYLTHWITRNHDWQWESKDRYQACIRAGFTPIISYWYFGDDISPEFVATNMDAYFDEIQNRLIPLIKDLPEVLILLEPEFNKNGIPEWNKWDGIMVRAIKLIKQNAPNARVGLVVGDWGEHEIKASFLNIERSVQLSDFIGFMEMISTFTNRSTFDPTWSMIERSNRIVRHLRQMFNKPVYLGYLAISTAGNWETKQADLIRQFMENVPWYINNGVFGASFFALYDNPLQQGWFSEAEKHFGLITADGKIKKGGYAWKENVRRIRSFDTTPPELIEGLILNHSGIDFQQDQSLIGAGSLSEWCKWRINIIGQSSNASRSIFGAGEKINFSWNGQSDKGDFIAEECLISLEAFDQAGNKIVSPPVLKFRIQLATNLIPLFTLSIRRSSGLRGWGKKSKIYFLNNTGARFVLPEWSGIDILPDFVQTISALALDDDLTEKSLKKRLGSRGIYYAPVFTPDNDSTLDMTFFLKEDCYLEVIMSFNSGFEGLSFGIVDSKEVRSMLNLEAYIQPGLSFGEIQKLVIPLADLPIAGHRYERDGKNIRQNISFKTMTKFIFTSSVVPVDFSIYKIRILKCRKGSESLLKAGQ